jgi:hypothetical protein
VAFGTHLSWGFEDDAFDEYYGEVQLLNPSTKNSSRPNSSTEYEESSINFFHKPQLIQQPHGNGLMIYSDGSIYVGTHQLL